MIFLYIDIKIKMRKPNNYWTKENCKNEALKYKSRTEFSKCSMGAYSAAKNRYKCLDDICNHMVAVGNKYKRCIYVYEFSDNYSYVGLTSNIYKRNQRHLKKGTVYKHIEKNSNYILKQLTNYIDVDNAIKLEHDYVLEYKKNNWNILNKSKTGSLGGHTKKWTKENCEIEALKYNTRNDFCKKSAGAYRSSLLNNWLDDVCKHMNNRNNWTKENCKNEALKYNTRFNFCKNCKSAYTSALNNGWLDELCEHMGDKKILRDYWTKEKCKEESLKYNGRGEFSIKSPYSYKVSRINKWLSEFFTKK
jgi:predicted GIY-YIG superfamily endonuclease